MSLPRWYWLSAAPRKGAEALSSSSVAGRPAQVSGTGRAQALD